MITAMLGPVKRISSMSGRTRDVRYHTAGAFKGKRIDVEIDDNSLLMLDFGDATFGIVDATFCVAASKAPEIEVYGSEGTLATEREGLTQTLSMFVPGKRDWVDVNVPPAPPVRDLGVFHLVSHLLEGTELVLTAERGRHLVEIMAKAVEASETGRTLDIATSFEY
jgi:predicted dehydrogenase